MSKTIAIACLRRGSTRPVNEDNYYLEGSYALNNGPEYRWKTYSGASSPQIFAVADGMGGEGLGDKASRAAMRVLDLHVKKSEKTGRFDFYSFARKFIAEANRTIFSLLGDYRGIEAGSTISLAVIEKNIAHTLSIGNSRVYLFREGRMQRLTRDHLSPLPDKKILSRHLGMDGEMQLTESDNLARTVLHSGDILLLCTDGVTAVLSEDQIADLLSRPEAFVRQVEQLDQIVEKQQGQDDMALIAIKVIDPDFSGETGQKSARRFSPVVLFSWFRPLLFFLLFLLLGFLAAKLIFSLPGWLRQLGG